MKKLRRKAAVAWSGGKDCAWALGVALQNPELEPALLWSTIREDTGRIGVHEVPFRDLQSQAASLDLPIAGLPLPWPCPNAEYEARTVASLSQLRREGFEVVVFGDLFLADIRTYREALLESSGLLPCFSLWNRPTKVLAGEMLEGGLEAKVVAVDEMRLGSEWIGRTYDRSFLEDLPIEIDPCGENGEFHTFVELGPGFRWPVVASEPAVPQRPSRS